jgi:hypothetical protein
MSELNEFQTLGAQRRDGEKAARRRTYRRWAFVFVVGLVALIPLFGHLSNGSVAASTPSAKVQALLDRYGPNSGEDFVVLEGPVDRLLHR